ncbi:GNAT family N-acetyltransferase [Leptothoe spongobia TAU-MAC 1115]|uniref:GNAT family N-acetyltransferase n=2 Tax=Leptothoe TaxID=2651725 RepID=A0A947GJQ7_9CYAN|nr:GNAT family N-acetyltransferase [Leptothoe spongobia TAU-MAC 1115]
MEVQIVPVAFEDKTELLDLMTRVICTSVTQEIDLQSSYIENITKNLEWWAANPELGCHLKAVNNETIVGVILVKKFWNLCSLFVVPECHRQGIGRALMMAAIDDCRAKSDKRAIHLNAAPDEIAFYRAMGFIPSKSDQSLPKGVEPMKFVLR